MHTHYAPGGIPLCGSEPIEANSYPVSCPDCREGLGWNGEKRYGVDSLSTMIEDGAL